MRARSPDRQDAHCRNSGHLRARTALRHHADPPLGKWKSASLPARSVADRAEVITSRRRCRVLDRPPPEPARCGVPAHRSFDDRSLRCFQCMPMIRLIAGARYRFVPMPQPVSCPQHPLDARVAMVGFAVDAPIRKPVPNQQSATVTVSPRWPRCHTPPDQPGARRSYGPRAGSVSPGSTA